MLSNLRNIESLFKMIDKVIIFKLGKLIKKDGSGSISADELKNIFDNNSITN